MVMRALKRNTAGQKNRHLELGGVGRLVRWVLREASLGCGDEQRLHCSDRGTMWIQGDEGCWQRKEQLQSPQGLISLSWTHGIWVHEDDQVMTWKQWCHWQKISLPEVAGGWGMPHHAGPLREEWGGGRRGVRGEPHRQSLGWGFHRKGGTRQKKQWRSG